MNAEPTWIVHDEKRMHLPELTDHCVLCQRAEVEALRAVLRKVQRSAGNWAALSYVDGFRGAPCKRWNAEERALLHRAGL